MADISKIKTPDGTSYDIKDATARAYPHDVKVNGTSVVTNGVANIPMATSSTPGVVIVDPSKTGLTQWTNSLDGKTYLVMNMANSSTIKDGSDVTKPISVARQNEGVFYGLAKAAGDTTQASSSNAVGTYTDDAKTAIKSMLGVTDLPTVTSSDNGKFLTVQNGAWTATTMTAWAGGTY